MEFFYLICIGATIGWFAGQFMTGKGFGVVGDVIAGVTGALISGVLIEKTGFLTGSGIFVFFIVAATGSIVFLQGVRMAKKT
jgi:uncharacterized membrane protein YeaQ/YmgE (transglycosylase-associated protein family)